MPYPLPSCYGLIGEFLSLDDARPAAEQIDQHYISGWRPQHGFAMAIYDGFKALYPGDPPLLPLAVVSFRDELLVMYPYGYLGIVQSDESYEIARVD
jgi:hypothetical protein